MNQEQSHWLTLHSTCYREQKTAVLLLGEEEIHLVALLSKHKNYPCFWCYSVPPGLYNACLPMLISRCLSIVFDLDETLIIANTIKSFEDRIRALQSCINTDTKADRVRKLEMSAEMKRYMGDLSLLEQYKDNDSIVDNGKVYKIQPEEVPEVSDSHARVVRPVIRLPEKNIVLTRINPEVRDTSVLVRLRPAWDDLRSYLVAKGRKRFEVYVCTMAKRDYALEMWRLLDPDAHLIGSKQLLDHIVCVKSGARKSLLNVFQDGKCHPKMAMVIDDRLKVWDAKDQPRVHVVPAFTPYYAPEAETANVVPALSVARNVACSVRCGFFKEFDENLLRSISKILYEDEVVNLPSVSDVSNYLMSEDASFGCRVGLIYDERMCKHCYPKHLEAPERIKRIWRKLQSAGIHRRCIFVNAEEAKDENIALVHTKEHIDLIKNISSIELADHWEKIAATFYSIYFNEGSSEAAYVAAGSIIKVAKKVAKRELDSAFAIIRPPRHHAEADQPLGFSLYNNVGIATSFLLDKRAELGINKILIVDWDVHHGNGTQKMFYKDHRVLFFSVHRYGHEHETFYPGGEDGSHVMIGEGPGKGYNINVPWKEGGCGDDDYLAVWEHLLIPVAKEFNPDLVMVSVGFDAGYNSHVNIMTALSQKWVYIYRSGWVYITINPKAIKL